MLNYSDFFEVLNKIAPISLSQKLIEKGDYDNSGILVNCHEKVEKVLFSLDLSIEAVDRAKKLKCDTIVTHHPAIYKPISSLSIKDEKTGALTYAIKCGLNVISMHLNLDVAEGGIDYSLAEALGAKNQKILDLLDGANGYGREFEVKETTLKDFVTRVKKELKTSKITLYGKTTARVNKCASFCGGGSSYAEEAVLKGQTEADVIVTSDVPHHVILSLVESGKNLVIIPHYASENYGFFKFYLQVNKALNNKVITEYFEDKRFL